MGLSPCFPRKPQPFFPDSSARCFCELRQRSGPFSHPTLCPCSPPLPPPGVCHRSVARDPSCISVGPQGAPGTWCPWAAGWFLDPDHEMVKQFHTQLQKHKTKKRPSGPRARCVLRLGPQSLVPGHGQAPGRPSGPSAGGVFTRRWGRRPASARGSRASKPRGPGRCPPPPRPRHPCPAPGGPLRSTGEMGAQPGPSPTRALVILF